MQMKSVAFCKKKQKNKTTPKKHKKNTNKNPTKKKTIKKPNGKIIERQTRHP
jgi:hypothetical protein